MAPCSYCSRHESNSHLFDALLLLAIHPFHEALSHSLRIGHFTIRIAPFSLPLERLVMHPRSSAYKLNEMSAALLLCLQQHSRIDPSSRSSKLRSRYRRYVRVNISGGKFDVASGGLTASGRTGKPRRRRRRKGVDRVRATSKGLAAACQTVFQGG